MPAKIALSMAQLVMKPEAPQNKLFFGAFLALDGKGDVGLARQMWKEAAEGGVDVKRLLPELDVERPLPPIEIPPVTPATRNLLAEKNWTLRVKTAKGWVRQPLGKIAEQNGEGRLVIHAPPDGKDELQLVTRRPTTGDFGASLILQDVKKGTVLGFFAEGAQDAGYYVELPAGTMLVEFGRQAGELKCLVAGKEREVKTLGKASPRMAGTLGISISAGSECTIAAIDFVGR
jgi:hypothetical protein